MNVLVNHKAATTLWLGLWLGTGVAASLVGCGASSAPLKDGGAAGKGTGAAGQTAGSGGGGGATGGTMGGAVGDSGDAGIDAAAGASVAADGGRDVGSDVADTGPDVGKPAVADAAPEVVKPDGAQGVTYTFDSSTQGWVFAPIGSTPVGLPASPNNLAVHSTMAWDSADDAENKTTSGSLQATVPFTKDGDKIDIQAFASPTAKYDWTGYTISAKVKLVSGGRIRAGCLLHAWLYVTAIPNFGRTISRPVDLPTGAWVTLTFDNAAAGVDTTMIQEMGVQVTTGPACAGPVDSWASDGGADAAVDAGGDGLTATTAVILLDDVIVSVN